MDLQIWLKTCVLRKKIPKIQESAKILIFAHLLRARCFVTKNGNRIIMMLHIFVMVLVYAQK